MPILLHCTIISRLRDAAPEPRGRHIPRSSSTHCSPWPRSGRAQTPARGSRLQRDPAAAWRRRIVFVTLPSFSDLGLIEPIRRALRTENYLDPTPIQAQAIPPLLAGKDLLGIAQTGTG